jgi:hypothetical protein
MKIGEATLIYDTRDTVTLSDLRTESGFKSCADLALRVYQLIKSGSTYVLLRGNTCRTVLLDLDPDWSGDIGILNQ